MLKKNIYIQPNSDRLIFVVEINVVMVLVGGVVVGWVSEELLQYIKTAVELP
jgi:hypothetical protein